MTAGETACACAICGVMCTGRFSSCSSVWERGPREVTLARPVTRRRPAVTPEGGTSPNGQSPAAVAPVTVAEADQAARGEVLEWLRSAFDGVRGDLALLIDSVGRQQQSIAALSETEAATARMVEMAEVLPDRVYAAVARAVTEGLAQMPGPEAGMKDAVRELSDELRLSLPGYIDGAVRDIVRPGQGAMMNRVDEVTAELRESLADVQASAAELRNEMARLAAFRSALVDDQPELADAVEAATRRTDGRLNALAQKMEALGERSEWQAVRSHLPFRRD